MSLNRQGFRLPASARARSARSPHRLRLAVEPLEDRTAPAVFTINTLADTVAVNLVTGQDASGHISLRSAIMAANSNFDADNTFNLPGGVCQLSIPNGAGGQENAGARGDLDVDNTNAGVPAKNFVFQGAGAGVTVIDGGDLDRVFHIDGGDVTATFRDLTIRNGTAQDDGGDGADPGTTSARGGGLLIINSEVTLEKVIVTQNVAQGGNGLDGSSSLVGFGEDGGFGQGAGGGGIFVKAFSGNLASLTVRNSTIRDNRASGGHGGHGGDGGSGGGQGGFGGHGFGGGIAAFDRAFVTVINSTLSSNTAQGGNGGHGGASGGFGGGNGGNGGNGGASEGGGLILIDGGVNLRNSTIAANQVIPSTPGLLGSAGGANGNPGATRGGGVRNAAIIVDAVSCIIGDNTTNLPVVPIAPPPEDDFSGNFNTASNNLLETAAGATGISDGFKGNIVGVDPKLGSLQNNGGPTPTHALLSDSPAINHGSNPDGLDTDQRGSGFARIFGGAADIGAFELQPPPSPPRPQIVAEAFKQGGKAKVRVKDAATGAVRKVLTPFGNFGGRLRLSFLDLNGDGSFDLVVQAKVKGKLKKRIYDAVTLAPL